MYLLTAKITIYSEKTWTFEKVKEVKIERDTDSLTDTCTITLPRKVKWKDEKTVPVKIGDKVSVELGYNNKLQPAFSGYITKISAIGALAIKCEDEMYWLKLTSVKVESYETATVSQVLKDQLPDMQIKVCGDQALGAYRVPSKESILFLDAVCNVVQTNTPVSTSLVGLAGTIKEGVAMGDYTITITAALVANQLGNWEQADFYPQDDVKDLARMLNKAQTLTVESAFLALFGINRLVVKEFTIDQTTQSNWQAVTIKADSDQDYTINYNEY